MLTRKPCAPTSAAAGLTLSPLPALAVHALRLPPSKLSAKMASGGEAVEVRVAVAVGAEVRVGVAVTVGEEEGVGVAEGVLDISGEGVLVWAAVAVGVWVGAGASLDRRA